MPEKIQNYTVSDRIGTGGTGIVRRGRETETKADVAVKSLNADLVREPQVRKRLKEATKSLLSMPRQENLVRVLDVVESGDTMHVIMEYAPGRSLDNLLSKKSRPMPYDNAVQLLNQALRGAQAAHSKGFLHGNLKPSDIIISGDNAVKISGFGIAPHLSNAALVRSAGRTGKIAYMAPEQVRGESVDERSDVYSLGVILYRMITGTMPYSVSDRDSESRLRQAVLQQTAPNITETMPELNIPPHLANLVHRAIAKDRRERIPTTREFARLLQKVQPEVQQIIAATPNQASGTKAAVIGTTTAAAAVTATGAAIAAASEETTRPAVAQFPPPQASPLAAAQPAAFATADETPKTTDDESQESPAVKEKSGLSAFFSKSSPPAPAPDAPTVFTAPTLAQSPMQLEVERRMQAMRTEQAQRAAEEERLQFSAPQSTDEPLGGSPLGAASYSTPVSGINPPPSPEALKAQLTPTEAIKPAAKNEEKKKRAVLPWLVMGAVALGGGIYYVALKNKSTDNTTPTMQRELSNDEKERRYDSLLAKSEKNAEQDPNAQNGAPLENGKQAGDQSADTTNTFPATANNPTTSTNQAAENTVPDESASSSASKNAAQNSPASAEKPRIPDSGEPIKNPEKKTTPIAEKAIPAEKKSASASKLAENNSTKSSPTAASKSAAKQAKPDNSIAEATPKKTAQRKQARASESGLARETPTSTEGAKTQKRASRNNTGSESMTNETATAKRSTEKTTASTAPANTSTTTPANTSTTKTTSKSGSLAEVNSQSAAEREAARERIRQKYAGHLKNKSSKSSTLATNTPFSTSTDAPSGKATPDALKDMNKKAPRTNREDNYAPATNPVAESPNTVDPSTTELTNAARKAKSVEPFLILRGHVGTVRSVSFSPDGKTIASGSDDKTVKIWDAATGTILRSLRGHSGTVTSVFFSPDGKTLISSGKDKTVRVWDAATGEAIQRSPGVSCEGTPAAFSPDGKFLATSDNRNINISKTQR